MDRIANNFCLTAHLEAPFVCSKITRLFNSEITKVLTYGVITPDQVCGLLSNNTCGQFHSPLDDWKINLEASHHLNLSQITSKRQVIFPNETSSDLFRVIHLSDTHVDLNYAAGSAAVCEEPLCCQATSTPKNTSVDPAQEKAGYWGHYGFCDVPLRLFVATLRHLNETLGKSRDIEYILWTGDIQPHDVWSQSKRTALQIYDTIFKRIFKHLPNVIILPTLGNHEMVPVDSFSPSNLASIARDDSPEWLYRKLDAFWSRWLPSDTEATVTRDGFYAATVRPGLKVISLNTNFCHSRNFWLFINSTDPGNQLQWLVHELQLSELAHERVHIIGHIPPGADDCLRVWSKNYNQIINRYAATITGQFFGHTHTSEFEMFYADQASATQSKLGAATASASKGANEKASEMPRSADVNNLLKMKSERKEPVASITVPVKPAKGGLKPISVAQIGPSITTFIDLNPSYRIYTIDPKRDFRPIDYETFYVNLTEANLAERSAKPQWHSAGFFSKKFGLQDITPESMHELVSSIATSLKISEAVSVSYEIENKDNSTDDEDKDQNGADADDNNDDDNDDDDETEDDAGSDGVNDDGHDQRRKNSTARAARPTVSGVNDSNRKQQSLNSKARLLGLGSDDRLYELYLLFNSYSDKFNRTVFEKITLEDRKKFLCRLLSGRSHDLTVCKQMIPTMDVPQLANI